jgi:hypothetical protein
MSGRALLPTIPRFLPKPKSDLIVVAMSAGEGEAGVRLDQRERPAINSVETSGASGKSCGRSLSEPYVFRVVLLWPPGWNLLMPRIN